MGGGESLEVKHQLLQQFAAVSVLFKFFETVPCDIQSGIARDHVAYEALARLPIGKQAGDVVRIGCQDEIGSDSAFVNSCDSLIEFVKVGRVWLVRPEIHLRAIAPVAENRTTKMI